MLSTEESDPALQVTGDVRRLRSVGEGYSVLGSTPAPSADRATTQENRNSTAGHFARIYVVSHIFDGIKCSVIFPGFHCTIASPADV